MYLRPSSTIILHHPPQQRIILHPLRIYQVIQYLMVILPISFFQTTTLLYPVPIPLLTKNLTVTQISSLLQLPLHVYHPWFYLRAKYIMLNQRLNQWRLRNWGRVYASSAQTVWLPSWKNDLMITFIFSWLIVNPLLILEKSPLLINLVSLPPPYNFHTDMVMLSTSTLDTDVIRKLIVLSMLF